MTRTRLFATMWRAEGLAGVVDRARDHLAASRRRARFRPTELAALAPVSVLRIAAAPPVPWLGGVPAQLGALLHEQERQHDTALLYPWRHGLRLEVVAGGSRRAAQLPLPRGFAGAGQPASWATAVRAAAAAVGARLLHVEGAAGLPHTVLAELARERPLVLSLHDFALFCPRPNLYDERLGSPCGYCADTATCHRHLAAAAHENAELAWDWRQHGGELLAACRCVVYPSEFLRATYERLFASAGALQRVIPPGIDDARALPGQWPWAARTAVPRVAFVGGGAAHKGGRLLVAVVSEWSRRGLPAMHWEVLGGGGAEQLQELRRLRLAGGSRLRVRGYYRHGTLGALLGAQRIELALLLPQVPESFSLSLSECLAAGVPLMALAHGALAERLAGGGGYLLPAGAATEQVVGALQAWREGRLPAPAPAPTVPTSVAAAAAYAALFEELLRGAAPSQPARFRYPPRRGDRLRSLAGAAQRALSVGGRWFRGEVATSELRAAWRVRRRASGPRAAARAARAAIVYLPALPWSFRFQRPQQLARAFVAAGHPVLYVEAFQRARVLPRRAIGVTTAGVEVLRLAVPGRPDPYRQSLAEAVAHGLADTIAAGISQPPLMVFSQLPFWAPVAVRLREMLGAPLVYDRIDLHGGFSGVPEEVERREAALMAAADLVLASSPALLDGCDRLPGRRALVPNAVSVDDFRSARRRFGEPVTVGYVGALGSWFDAGAVAALAAARPQWQVRLAGRVETPEVQVLGRYRNVELLGEISYDEVPGFMAGLQALLIPFLDLPLTRAVDPVKLYEALAAGVPVVSYRLPAVEAWGEPFVYSYERGGLLAAVERALAADGAELARRRRAAMAAETWEARAAAVLELLA